MNGIRELRESMQCGTSKMPLKPRPVLALTVLYDALRDCYTRVHRLNDGGTLTEFSLYYRRDACGAWVVAYPASFEGNRCGTRRLDTNALASHVRPVTDPLDLPTC